MNCPYSESTIEQILNRLGGDLFFVEVGVLRATTLVHVADKCFNVKRIVGVDFYQPYVDCLGESKYNVDMPTSLLNYQIAKDRISRCSRPEIIDLVIKESKDAALLIEDSTVDCIFLDAYMSLSDVVSHINTWMPKLKKDGVLLGHDIHTQTVIDGLLSAGIKYDILPHNVWILKKD